VSPSSRSSSNPGLVRQMKIEHAQRLNSTVEVAARRQGAFTRATLLLSAGSGSQAATSHSSPWLIQARGFCAELCARTSTMNGCASSSARRAACTSCSVCCRSRWRAGALLVERLQLGPPRVDPRIDEVSGEKSPDVTISPCDRRQHRRRTQTFQRRRARPLTYVGHDSRRGSDRKLRVQHSFQGTPRAGSECQVPTDSERL